MTATKEMLSNSDIRYNCLIGSTPDVIGELDLDGTISFISQQIYDLLGFHPDEMIGTNLIKSIHPDDIPDIRKAIKKAIKSKEVMLPKLRLKHKKGNYILVFAKGKLVKLDDKAKLIGFIRDLTKFNETEKKLEETQDIFEQLNEVFLKFKEDPIFNLQLLTNTGGLLLKAYCALFNILKRVNGKDVLESLVTYNEPPNFTRESDPKGHICTDIIKDNPDGVVIISNLDKTNYIKTDENVRKYGLKQWVGYVVRFNNKPIATFCVVYTENREMSNNDITILQILSKSASAELARWNSQIDLEKSEEKYRHLLENLDVGFYQVSLDGQMLNHNRAHNIILGYDPTTSLKNKDVREFWQHPEQREDYIKLLLEKGIVKNYKCYALTKDGRKKVVELNSHLIRDENGKPIRINGTFNDITDQMKAEQKLKESEEKLRSIYKGIPVPTYTWQKVETDLILINYNDAAEKITDGKITNVLGIKASDLYKDHQEILGDLYQCANEKANFSREMNYLYKTTGKEEYLAVKYGFVPPDLVLVHTEVITERKAAEQKLKESEELLRLERDNLTNILNTMEDGVYLVDSNYEIEYVNPFLTKEFGRYEGKKCYNYFNDREEACPWCKNQEVFIGKTVRREWYSAKNQKTYDLIDTPLKNVDGSISKLTIFRDITARKEKEAAARLHSEIMTNMSEGVYLIRLEDLIIFYVNPRFEEMFGYDPGELIGKYVVIVNAPTDKTPEETKHEIVGILKDTGEWHGEMLNIKKDGTPFWCYANVSLFNHPEYGRIIVSVHTDITERKKAEQKLKESEEKYRNLVDNAQEGVWAVDANDDTIFVNPKICEMLGYTRDEMMGKNLDLFLDDSMMELTNSYRKQREKSLKDTYELELIKKDGIPIYTSIKAAPILGENGEFKGSFAYITDITKRKKAEQKLKESEEKYRVLVETAVMGLVEFDVIRNKVSYINPKLLEILGHTKEELLNEKIFMGIVHPEDQKDLIRSSEDKYIEFRIYAKDQKLRWLSGIRSNQYNQEGNIVSTRLWLQDTTEGKELEELKSNLITRFSHEFKTPLISIKGFTDLLLTVHRRSLSKQAISFLERIKAGGDRLNSLINRFIETTQLGKQRVKLNMSYENFYNLIKKSIAEMEGLIKLRNHTINVNIPDELLMYLDKGKIQTIISNLLTNAINNTPSGGNITINSRMKKNTLIISVKDDGIGLQKEELAQLFKPFGKIEKYGRGWDVISDGIGLGLYLSKEIIELHDGKIWAESEGISKGSTFYFSIPIIK